MIENWHYSLFLINDFQNGICDYYIYEAKFSVPCEAYPVPQACISIFFGIEVSSVIPAVCPVRVTFAVEGSKMVHIPGKHCITEEMLQRAAEVKIAVFRRLQW